MSSAEMIAIGLVLGGCAPRSGSASLAAFVPAVIGSRQILTGTAAGGRSLSRRRNLSITRRVIDRAILGSLRMAASISACGTLTTEELRNAMIEAERGSPVNIASS